MIHILIDDASQGKPEVREVAQALIGCEVWVGWPHLVEAKVVAVQSHQVYIDTQGEKKEETFPKLSHSIKSQYSNRYGVEIGDVSILVHALPMSGRKYVMGAGKGRITLEKQWHNISQPFALQAIVKDILVEDPGLKTYCTVEELFPTGTQAFMLGQPHYGAQGEVIKIDPEHKGRIQLKFRVSPEPELGAVMARQSKSGDAYMPGYRAAQRCGVSGHIVARITGTIFVVRGAREQQSDSASKTNIGLNLKFSKRQEEVCGYTKRTEDGQWLYSLATVQLILEYQQNFPEVFDYICSGSSASMDMFHELDLFPATDGLERMAELAKWLEGLPSQAALRQPYGTQTLEEGIIKELEEVTAASAGAPGRKEVVMQVKPHLLYLPNHLAGCALVEPGTVFCLYDRVVNVREGFSVPLGLRGTVIRIQKAPRVEDNVYDVLFDEVFTGGLTLRCSPGRGYRMPGSAMINLTFKECGGRRPKQEARADKSAKPRAVVRPFDNQEAGESSGQARPRENPWHSRNKNPPTGQARPQPRQQSEPKVEAGPSSKGASVPPPPQLLPRPGDSLLAGKNKAAAKKEEPKIRIMTKQNAQDGNFQDIWQALSAGNKPANGDKKEKTPEAAELKNGASASTAATQSVPSKPISIASSVSDMENDLKSLLNISKGSEEEKPKFVIGGASFDPAVAAGGAPQMSELVHNQSYCRVLMAQVTSAGGAMPRYDYITEPGSGLVAAQVTLEDGSMFHSPAPTGDKDHASETAARVALESLGLVPAQGPGVAGAGRRGGRGRGHRGKQQQQQVVNQFQPWAEFSGHYPAAKENRREQNLHLAGSGQMDIRYRDKPADPQLPPGDPRLKPGVTKPAFVPLQVSKRAVKPVRSEERREEEQLEQDAVLPDLERVPGTAVTKKEVTVTPSPRSSASKESTPGPGRGGGRGQGQRQRKVRMAANFGGEEQQ